MAHGSWSEEGAQHAAPLRGRRPFVPYARSHLPHRETKTHVAYGVWLVVGGRRSVLRRYVGSDLSCHMPRAICHMLVFSRRSFAGPVQR